MTADQLAKATFEELVAFIRSGDNDAFFEDKDNARAFFARFHDVIDEESKKAADFMEKYGAGEDEGLSGAKARNGASDSDVPL